jgi:hypothetical protein
LESAGQRYQRVRKKYKRDSFVSLARKKNCVSSYPEPGIKIQKSIQYIYLVDIVTDNEMYYG